MGLRPELSARLVGQMISEIDRLSAHASELRRLRQPYVTVKVVWVAPPSSGKPGNAALVTEDGRVDGWVGGSCAEPVVMREAMATLETGVPRLVHLGPSADLDQPRDGVINVAMGCASEGSMEIFLEPHVPAPRLVVVGRAPVVRTLVGMARAIDFEVLVVERESTEPWPAGVEVTSDLDLLGVGIGTESYVVVATFGRYDEEALGAALATDAAYVGLVASAKRGATVLELMGSMGTAESALARVHCPAGLDLGSLPHTHMAVPILAEIVAERARRSASPTAASPTAGPPEADVQRSTVVIDPVCGMTVDLATASETAHHDGITYGFCCGGCRLRFVADPPSYLHSTIGN